MANMPENIVEAVLTHLSKVPVVGDVLEAMSAEDYDKLEEELLETVLSCIAYNRD